MANRARGEVGVRIGNATVPLALNLGALAAIEEEFSSDSFEAVIDDVLAAEKLSASKLLRFLTAVARANDAPEAVIDTLAKTMPADLREAALGLVAGAFPEPGAKKGHKTPNP